MCDTTSEDTPLEANLTRAQAALRATRVSGVCYDLAIDLPGESETFGGRASVHFVVKDGEGPVFLDFFPAALERVSLNGTELDHGIWDGTHLNLPENFLEDQNHLEVTYRGEFHRKGLGFHRFIDPADGGEYVYTNLEPYAAHQVFPCFDQPDIKASYRLTVDAPAHWEVVSNVREESVLAEGERAVHTFPETARFSTYLFNLTAGPFEVWEDEDARIPSRVLARASIAESIDAGAVFEVTRKGFEFYEEYFQTPYPFPKYDQVFAPEFMTGAMENVGAVLINDMRYVHRHSPSQEDLLERDMVLLHEMAHMWFGNLVTMRWWDGLWLNESFATYLSFLALDAQETYGDAGWVYFDSKLRAWATWQDELSTTHAIELDIPETRGCFTNFDGITYGKGCCVLKQLAHHLGEDTFRAGVAEYFRSHAWGNTSNHDFLASLAETAGRDLDGWADVWLHKSGVNTLAVERPAGPGEPLKLTQTPGNGDGITRPHKLKVGFFSLDGGELVGTEVDVVVEGAETLVEMPELPGELAFVHPNLYGYGYVKAALDARSRRGLREHVRKIQSPGVRSSLVDMLKQMTRDANLSAPDFVDAALRLLETEDYPPILETLGSFVPTCLSSYMPPKTRNPMAARLHSLARRKLADETRQGVGNLAWFRLMLGSAFEGEALEHLGKMLDGEVALPHFEIDQARRWDLVGRLVYRGAAEAAKRLAAETASDQSDYGHIAAASLSAAAPDLDGKAAAWERFVGPAGASLELDKAAYGSFHRPLHSGLTEEYAEKYLEVLPVIAKERDDLAAVAFAKGLFPSYSDDAELEAKVKARAESGELTAGMRRGLVEGLDDWKRRREIREVAKRG